MTMLIAVVVFLSTLMATSQSRAEPDYAVWMAAHERMLAKWRCQQPRCGWTVGGYTCSSRVGTRSSRGHLR
jgi:hypothetical protein